MGGEGPPPRQGSSDNDGLALHIKHISAVEPAAAMISGQNPDVTVQLIQPGIEELQTPRAQDINGNLDLAASDSGLASVTDYFTPAARASDTSNPPSPRTARRRSSNLASLSRRPLDSPSNSDLSSSSEVPQRIESALARSVAAQRDSLASASTNSGGHSDTKPRLRPQRSVTDYPSSAEPLRHSPDAIYPSSRSSSTRFRSSDLDGPPAGRQPHTTGNTPLHTPHLFSPRASRPNARPPYLHTQGPFASPYLHPVQLHHPQPPKETSKVTKEIDPSGRKIINQYEILEEIGRGAHGKVKLARELDTGNHVAIKIVTRHSSKKSLGGTKNPHATQEDQVRKEVAILKKAIHRNVVSMIEVIDDPDLKKIYLVLEFCEQHDVKWRTPGESEILLLEHRRLQHEKQGGSVYDVQFESDRILRSAVRRRQRAAQRRAPLSRINSQDDFCWSLEYAGGDSEDDDETHQSESVSGSISRISTRPSIPIPNSTSQPHEPEDLSPTNTRFVETQSPEAVEKPSQLQDEVPELAQSWDMRDLHTHLRHHMEHLEDAADPAVRKASVAESSMSHLTDMMESEIVDQECRYVPLLTLAETRRAFRDALLGLEYLHYQGIVHRDIKPENLLRKADHSVKISDFGVSYLGKPQRDGKESEDGSENEGPDHEEEAELAKTVGTPAFYAPELCSLEFTAERPRVTPQIDVWALGVVLYCLVYARLPFQASNQFRMMRCIAEDEVSFSRKRLRAVDTSSHAPGSHSPAFRSPYHRLPHELAYDDIDDDLLDLLKRLFHKDPIKRIQVKEIKHHPWVLRDIANPVAWQEETDPARFTQGKKIEISTAEVNDAVIPLKILERAKSVAKKVGGALGLSTSKPTRKRGQSSANSSEVGSVGSSHSPTGTSNVRKGSIHSEDGLFAGKRDSVHQHNLQEHPLSQSVTASPDIEKSHQSFETAFASQVSSADSFADFQKRPALAARQASSMSTAGSIKTIKQSDILPKQPEHIASPPPEPTTQHGHRDILSTASISALFGGAGRSIMRTMSRSRRGSESGSRTSSRPPSPKARDAQAHSHGHGHGHGEPSTAVSIASAAGTVQQPPRTQPSASPSPDSRRTSIIGGVPPSALPHAVQEAAARRGSPFIGSPPSSRASPVPEAGDADYNELRQQVYRHRRIQEAQARESSDATSPEDEITPEGVTERSSTSPGFLPLNSTANSPSPRPREQSLVHISSFSSEDRVNSGLSQSTSHPSVPSVMSANSSVAPDEGDARKDESPQLSQGTNVAEFQTLPQGPMATRTGPLVLTEARKEALDRETHSALESDNDDSDDSDEFLVMGQSKKPRLPVAPSRQHSNTASSRRDSDRRERRPSTLAKGVQESFQP